MLWGVFLYSAGILAFNLEKGLFLCKNCEFGVVFYNNAIYMGSIPN